MVSSTLKINEKKPSKYPKSVAFIICNEFCERFNFYGMRTILVLYLTRKLEYTTDAATVLFHVFTMLVYLFPLIGAIIADSWLGRFKTILHLSIVYTIGTVIISVGAIPTFHLPVKEATVLGLLLIAIGTGGIKPCVSAFGGDQFKVPEQAKQLAMFFSLFYFAINAGSLISTSITPILREDVHCFGEQDCFSLAFGVPAILMVVSLIVFVAGKPLYSIKEPAGNMIVGVSKCITEGVRTWCRDRKTNPKKHWLDHAELKCGQQLVKDTKSLLKILVLYLPIPFFWALFDQQGSRWTFQATRMVGDVWGYTIKPDQMQVINPLLILGFIPLFNYALYPMLEKIGIKRPLQKLTLGGFLAALAFVFSGMVELKLQAVAPRVPGPMEGQLRVYNSMPCSYNFKTFLPSNETFKMFTVNSLDVYEDKDLMVPNAITYNYTATSSTNRSSNCPDLNGILNMEPGKAVSYFIKRGVNGSIETVRFIDDPNIPKSGDPALRILMNVPQSESSFTLKNGDLKKEIATKSTDLLTVIRGETVLMSGGKTIANVTTALGGSYAMIVMGDSATGYTFKVHIITEPNSVHMLWQLPQLIVITAGEVMFSVTGLEFSFTQAPTSMKSVLQACWLLTVAIGNMLVVVIAELKFFESQSAEFFLFAILMSVDMIIFILLALRYTYVENIEDDMETGVSSIERNDGSSARNSTTETGQYNKSFTNEET